MKSIAFRMCCPGDEKIVQSGQCESKEDNGYDTPTVSSTDATNVQSSSGASIISFRDSSNIETTTCDSPSPLKSPVKRPVKTTDQLEKEYLENIAALTDRDEEQRQKAVSLLAVDRLDIQLSQEEQRTLASIDEYYASLRADQEHLLEKILH
jgi:hypothetical protein